MSRTTAIIIIVVTIIVMALAISFIKEAGGAIGIIGFAIIFYVIGQLKKLNKKTRKEWEEIKKK